MAIALAAAGALAAAAPAPLRAMRWLAPDRDPARALAMRPAECLATPAAPEAAYAVEVGRAAFRTPVLLGGQAARAGLSCESCHRAGRTNPDFRFPGVSGAPGTADVTSSLFSTHRGDGVDNPRPIPDLAAAKASLKIAQDPGSPALAGFIRGLVVEEFDGPEPAPAVLAGLAAYVRALSPAACPARARRRVRVADAVDDARRAARTAVAALDRADPDTAVVMIAAARWQLGLIDERYRGLDAEQARLRAADLQLAAAAAAVRAHDPAAGDRLVAWIAASQAWGAALAGTESRSLFDPARLGR